MIWVGLISICEWPSFPVFDLPVVNSFVHNLCLIFKAVLGGSRREAATSVGLCWMCRVVFYKIRLTYLQKMHYECEKTGTKVSAFQVKFSSQSMNLSSGSLQYSRIRMCWLARWNHVLWSSSSIFSHGYCFFLP